MTTLALTPEDYAAFRTFLQEVSGIVLGDNKQYLVTSRLSRLMQETGLESFGALMRQLKIDSKLRHRIMDAMTTNETSWFRDSYPFDILKEHILPELAKGQPRQIRIWSAACSTGQEAYSISMTIAEYQLANPGALSTFIEIVGTDISPTVLKMARDAVYDEINIVRGLSEERRDRYLVKQDDKWKMRDAIKAPARFAELNLLNSYSLLGKFDIIFCRNVLIYFSTESKTDILNRMAQILNPGGYLILGGSESPTGYSPAYEMVRYQQGVIYRLKGTW